MPEAKDKTRHLNRSGRPPGTKNKMPLQVAEAVRNALDYAGGHLQEVERLRIEKALKEAAKKNAKKEGVEPPDLTPILAKMTPAEAYLMTQALNEPKTFLSLVAKLMPAKVEADITIFQGKELVDKLQVGRALAAKQIEDKRRAARAVH